MITDPRKEITHIGRGDSFFSALTIFHDMHIEDPIFVEVGTTRGGYGGGPSGDGWATNAWGWYCKNFGGRVHTIDIDENCIDQCKQITIKFKDVIEYHVMTGVEFLDKILDRNINFLYLDGGDDPQEMVDEYSFAKKWLGDKSLILLDDIPPDCLNAGKGRLLIPILLRDGWRIRYHDINQSVMQMLFERNNQ